MEVYLMRMECSSSSSGDSLYVEISLLVTKILVEIYSHLGFHDAQTASDDTFVVDLANHKSVMRMRLSKGKFRGW